MVNSLGKSSVQDKQYLTCHPSKVSFLVSFPLFPEKNFTLDKNLSLTDSWRRPTVEHVSHNGEPD